MKDKANNHIVYLYSATAVILWGLSYIWSEKLLGQGIPIEYFVSIRVLFAGTILLLFNLIAGADMRIHKKDLHKFLLLALCEPLIYFICETYGIALTESPTYAAMIVASTPIFALAAGTLFFKEKMRAVNIVGTVICIFGILLMTATSGGVGKHFVLGIILLAVAVFAEVGQASCTKWLAGDYKPQVITMYQFLIGGAYLTPVFFLKGLNRFDPALYLSWSVWEPILFLAVLCSCLSFTLWVGSIKNLGVARSAVLQSLIPVVTAVAGIIQGTEILGGLQWLGIAVASAGVILSQLNTERKSGRKSSTPR
ncbi:MAG: DMT family transporter [Bacteroidales bacterium]|nr:DMT family transporter [Bacteroidales bacterium]